MSQQRLAQAGLVSLQARIDLDYVFSTLGRLERLYEADPAAAGLLLDELIVVLRSRLAGLRTAGEPGVAVPRQVALATVQESGLK